MNFKFEKYLIYKISNFKLNYKKADKSVLSEVNYEKTAFQKKNSEKNRTV
jgi:hypothetical protein